ncbi:MAG TPA: hypothetical protein VGM05_05960 [Planctomycetaceae bacterium]|jgi:hypothetical protein
MNLTAVVERISEDRYRAVITQPLFIESEGHTPDEAVKLVQELATNRLALAQIIQIAIPEQRRSHPWARWAGVWKDNPDFERYLANIAEYRREADASESPE